MALLKTIYLQGQKYPAEIDRYAVFSDLQPGVYDPTDFQVTAQSPASMGLNIGAGRALVADRRTSGVNGGPTAGAWLGKYLQANDATLTLGIDPNSAGVTRIDQVLLVVNDANAPYLTVAPGTPTTGATLDNRSGATDDTTLTVNYGNWLRLADVRVDNGVSSIPSTMIRDRRPWARGAFYNYTRPAAAGNLTTASASLSNIDSAVWSPRIECSGAPIEITLVTDVLLAAASTLTFGLSIDGAASIPRGINYQTGNEESHTTIWRPTVTPGSHQFTVQWSSSTGELATLFASALPSLTVEERPRQNVSNG